MKLKVDGSKVSRRQEIRMVPLVGHSLLEELVGATIAAAFMDGERLLLVFAEGPALAIYRKSGDEGHFFEMINEKVVRQIVKQRTAELGSLAVAWALEGSKEDRR